MTREYSAESAGETETRRGPFDGPPPAAPRGLTPRVNKPQSKCYGLLSRGVRSREAACVAGRGVSMRRRLCVQSTASRRTIAASSTRQPPSAAPSDPLRGLVRSLQRVFVNFVVKDQ